jgi:hypothetical protein
MELIKVEWKRPDWFTLALIAGYFGGLALGLWTLGFWS